MYKLLIVLSLFVFDFKIALGQSDEMIEIVYEARVIYDLDQVEVFGKSIRNTDFEKAYREVEKERFEFNMLLNSNSSYFEPIKKIDNNQYENMSDPGKIKIIPTLGNPTFKDLNKGIYYLSSDYTGELVYISESIPEYNWEIQKDTKEILGYEVRKAICTSNNKGLTAWYAPKLPYSNGPKLVGGLPGLILELETDNIGEDKATHIFTAKSIKVKSKSSKLDKFGPKKNTKIMTRAEFNIEVEKIKEKQKEFFKSDAVDKD